MIGGQQRIGRIQYWTINAGLSKSRNGADNCHVYAVITAFDTAFKRNWSCKYAVYVKLQPFLSLCKDSVVLF
jgi:hypothetical protein